MTATPAPAIWISWRRSAEAGGHGARYFCTDICDGERKSQEEMEAILAQRRQAWKPKPCKYRRGVLRMFSEHAASPMKGAYLDYD